MSTSTSCHRRAFHSPLVEHRLSLYDHAATTPFDEACKLIHDIAHAQGQLNWVVENVLGAGWVQKVRDAIGDPVMVRAHGLGSTARGDTLMWTNIHSVGALQEHYQEAMRRPLTVAELITQAQVPGTREWTVPSHLPDIVTPKFASRKGSYAYRRHGPTLGRGMHASLQRREYGAKLRHSCCKHRVSATRPTQQQHV